MKKVQAFFLVLALSLLLVVPSYAVTDRAGSCGNQVQWSLDERTGVLTISGSGLWLIISWIGRRVKQARGSVAKQMPLGGPIEKKLRR